MAQDGARGTAESDNKAIICDVLGRAPDVEMGSIGEGWSLCRWRQFVGSYTLPALPDPIFTVHVAGKPQVKVTSLDVTGGEAKRLGFMSGQIEVPEDFDRMGAREIEKLFGGGK